MAMINRIRSLFASMDSPDAPELGQGDTDKRLAAAVLLVEAAAIDGEFGDQERAAMNEILTKEFDLNGEELETLVAEAAKVQSESNQLLRFTRAIKDAYPLEERVKVIEMLWKIVYADGILHDYEANLVRRVCGLLYVPDRDQGEARKRVLSRISPTPEPKP
jgi:uncharacterized tellurite resistance protein B-like protein